MNATLAVWLQLFALLAAEAGLVIGIASQVERFTQSALWRRTLWQVCISSLLLLTLFEFTGTARGFLAWRENRSEKRSGPTAPMVPRKVSDASGVLLPAVQSGFQPMNLTQAAPRRQSEQASRAGEKLPVARDPITSAGATAGQPNRMPGIPNRAGETSPLADSMAVLGLGILWMAGAALILGRVIFSRLALEILRWRRGDVRERALEELTRRLASQLGIRRRVRLLESARFTGPVTFGMLRPTVGLPADFGARYTPVQQEAMLAHEVAHLAGGDPAWYLAADLLASVLWWHPMVWWARRRLHAECEMAADEASLVVADGPGALAECLVELGRRLTRREAPGRMGVAGSGFRSALGRRVDRLISLEGSDWCPPNRWHTGAVKMIGPLVLVAMTISASAWAVPQALTKGENMQTMRQTWKQSLAAFALLATLGSDGNTILAQPASPQPPVAPRPPVAPMASQALIHPEVAVPPPPRYYYIGRNQKSDENALPSTKEQDEIMGKLQRIRLEEVLYPGVSLGDIIKQLVVGSRKLDPENQGINFVLNRQTPTPTSMTVDQNGLPVASAPVEGFDLSQVAVKIDPPLHNVRLIDVLNAITKTADYPVKYSIEDYGVLFSADTERPQAPRSERMAIESDASVTQGVQRLLNPLEVETYWFMDTNTFVAGLESAFGIKVNMDGHQTGAGGLQLEFTIQDGLKRLLEKLGIKMDVPNKSVFFNDRTGVIMLRATHEDEEVFCAAMETLGGGARGQLRSRSANSVPAAVPNHRSGNPSE